MHRTTTFGLRASFILLSMLFIAACTSAPPKPEVDFNSEYNFAMATKVAFYKSSGMVSGDKPLQVSDMQRNRVDKALQLALENRGMTFVDDPKQADLLLTWHLSTQNKTDVRTYSSPGYSGYYGGYNRYSRYNCWNCMGGGTEVSVKNYTEGTFIVDMIDPKAHQSVWRGVTQSRLKGNLDNEQEKYNEAAAVIFAEFPPY
jgi:Domain of unknown function (DUF4136)